MSLPRFAGAQSARQGCAYGCPLPAIVAAFGLDERTASAWQSLAGEQCQRVHAQVVQQPRDLGQVQADELYVKLQGG